MDTTVTTTALLHGLHDPKNEAIWRQFCLRFEPMLRAYARRLGVPEQDIADLVQEILVGFLTSFRNNRYDPTLGRLRDWIKGIAVNQIRLLYRRRQRPERQLPPGSGTSDPWGRIPDEPQLKDAFDREWEQAVLQQCLEAVREQVESSTYEAFRLCVLEGKPPREVAEALGISRNAVYIGKHRVLGLLRQIEKDISATW
jgi:RNA polymerase sigma-70 factor, ECF subfamily